MKVDKFRTVIIYIIIILLGLVCLLPLLNIVAISFSSSAAVEGNMVGLIPVGFSTAAYEKILEDSQFWHSFLISVERVVLTLIINFVLIVLMAYPLSKTNAQFRGRNIYANLMIFAMLFNGGMIPTFLLVKSYGLLNTVWALVLPGAVPIFNVILVMNFFAAVPKELEEAAFIDGANPLQVLTKIFIPISKPVLATVSLFSIVGSWNDFYSGLIYMSKAAYYPPDDLYPESADQRGRSDQAGQSVCRGGFCLPGQHQPQCSQDRCCSYPAAADLSPAAAVLRFRHCGGLG